MNIDKKLLNTWNRKFIGKSFDVAIQILIEYMEIDNQIEE